MTGGETDVFSRAPAPTSLVVDVVDTYGTRTNLTTAKLPTNEIDLGDLPRTNVASVQVTGKDDVGTRLVYGATVGIQFAVLEGAVLPVFVQRAGEWARYPAALPDGRSVPLLVATARSVIVAGGNEPGSSMQVSGYDVAAFSALTTNTVTRAARSMAIANAAAILVDDAGATGLDLSAGTTFDVAAPSGGSYVEVAGGPTIYGDDGEAYIVGAGRTAGAPTARVLELDSAGKVTFVTMGAARLGAAVAWAKGRGLLVMGGNDTAPGVELLPKGATGAVSVLSCGRDTRRVGRQPDRHDGGRGGRARRTREPATNARLRPHVRGELRDVRLDGGVCPGAEPNATLQYQSDHGASGGRRSVRRDAHRSPRRRERDGAPADDPEATRQRGESRDRVHRPRRRRERDPGELRSVGAIGR